MFNSKRWTIAEIIFAIIMLSLVLFLQGAIPFLMIPTLGQAVWTTGFAQSFTHGNIFTIYAHDIGIPQHAAIAFGLAGAWPVSVFLRLGFSPADAYAFMMMLWFSVAFFSAYLVARKFLHTRIMALLGAVTWMSMSIIWAHAGYSMLSLGMALLPFYYIAAMNLFFIYSEAPSRRVMFFYFFVVMISVFMDGYTFVMFFSGATILFFYQIKAHVELRNILWKKCFVVHMCSFIFAYLVYAIFIGQSGFEKFPLTVFRGFGLDLAFMAIPTKSQHWIADLLGYSVPRSKDLYFGDTSVWNTTFFLPIMLAGCIAWSLLRKKIKMATGFFIVMLFAFYMSLGPSLKINSIKSEKLKTMLPMPADFAVMPLANGWMYKVLPGVNNMRSTYRWSALTIFACWCLLMLASANLGEKKRILWSGIFITIIVLNLPHLPKKFQENKNFRTMFFQIDQDLVLLLERYIKKDEIVAFIPWGNDFFVDYLAPKVGFRTYNIGGDKNLQIAQRSWPKEMLQAGPPPLEQNQLLAGLALLRVKKADVLVLPYFDLLWAAHRWPCNRFEDFSCVTKHEQDLRPFIQQLQTMPDLEVKMTRLFATVRLK